VANQHLVVNSHEKHIFKLVGSKGICYNLSVRVLMTGIWLQWAYLAVVQKNGKNTNKQILLLQIHSRCTNIIRQYFISRKVYVTGKFGKGKVATLQLN
jgi:hypothetical protein